MSCISIDDEPNCKYKNCTKCGCNFKLHIARRSERRSCLYHNFVDDYCIDCGCFKHQVENKNCLHIYVSKNCLSCFV